jgi:hypothetical protein
MANISVTKITEAGSKLFVEGVVDGKEVTAEGFASVYDTAKSTLHKELYPKQLLARAAGEPSHKVPIQPVLPVPVPVADIPVAAVRVEPPHPVHEAVQPHVPFIPYVPTFREKAGYWLRANWPFLVLAAGEILIAAKVFHG